MPLNPAKVTAAGNAIEALAIRGSIKTIASPTRQELEHVLHWSFSATDSAAHSLDQQFGSDSRHVDTILLRRR